MRVGVFTPLLSQLALPEVLKKLAGHGIKTVELGTGNYPGNAHCSLDMLSNKAKLREFRQVIADHGFSISALSCHGNPLHPNAAIAKQHSEVNRKTILLAEALGVPVVVDFSGCPGDSPKAKYPNWVTCLWPPGKSANPRAPSRNNDGSFTEMRLASLRSPIHSSSGRS